MTGNRSSLRYWVVNCLGCKNPIPLYAEIDPDISFVEGELASERSFFRAWCVECGRVYPYLSEAKIGADDPPKGKHHQELQVNRIRCAALGD